MRDMESLGLMLVGVTQGAHLPISNRCRVIFRIVSKQVAKYFMPGWWHKRQERKARTAKLRQRDGDNCWRCGHPMRFGPPHNVGRAATVEHHTPLSMGGTWALDNLRL